MIVSSGCYSREDIYILFILIKKLIKKEKSPKIKFYFVLKMGMITKVSNLFHKKE